MTKGEEEFIDQMTRKMMVDWCLDAVGLANFSSGVGDDDPFIQHALKKKWISGVSHTSDTHTYRILSGGWETAARFLKR